MMCIYMCLNDIKMKWIVSIKQTLFHQFPLVHYLELIMAEKLKTVQLCITLTVISFHTIEKTKSIYNEI